MKITLAILAAGLGSRFGSDKQLKQIHNNNILLDYSIYDAIQAGFDSVVLIVRSEIDSIVREHFAHKFKDISISFVYQDKLSPKEIERQKPWGTGFALLCLKQEVNNPFLIINADDYYGKSAFVTMAKMLRNMPSKTYFSAGYRLKNTLSENGTVSRGVCNVDSDGFLKDITERTKLSLKDSVNAFDADSQKEIPLESFVSMNFWGFSKSVFPIADSLFNEFVEQNKNNPKSEFYIPTIVQKSMEMGYKIKVVANEERWFGMTYLEDFALVQKEILKKTQQGLYPETF